MLCPACGGRMTELIKSDVIVEACDKGCGGMWFDKAELEKIDEMRDSAGQALLDLGPHKRPAADQTAQRRCPNCRDAVMQRHFFSTRQDIEVDECGSCGGIWLDTGDLAVIRQQFRTAQERKQAAEAYFSQRFSDEVAAETTRAHAQAQWARKFARAMRFLSPSHWIPGKQGWGGF